MFQQQALKRIHSRGRLSLLHRLFLTVALVGVAVAAAGCKDRASSGAGSTNAASSSDEPPEALPPLTLKDDTKDLLLTWVDDQGDFHVTQKIQEVPAGSREKVRVVVGMSSAGTGDRVYVADLREKRSDGTYSTTTLSRQQWEEIGASKRAARLEALAPSVKRAMEGPPVGSSATVDGVSAVIYGADWCQPCHQAEALLKKLGVKVQKKDIERDPSAQREMQAALQRAGYNGGSIPVIDVMGKVFVGFNASAIRKAVDTARRSATL